MEKETSLSMVAPVPLYRPRRPLVRSSSWVMPQADTLGISAARPAALSDAATLPASCSWILSSSMGVVTTIWQKPAHPPAAISRWTGRRPSRVVSLWRK